MMHYDFEPKIERAATPPSRFYTDPKALELEKINVFYRTWQLVARVGQLPDPGCYMTVDVCGESVLLVRDRGGVLRGFFNVCRHRGGPVAEGSGCRSAFQCAYHGWTYSLEGRLLATPEFDGVECFDKSKVQLPPVEVEVWEGLIFARLIAGPLMGQASRPGSGHHGPEENGEVIGRAPATCVSLLDYLGDIPNAVGSMSVASMALVQRRDYFVDCNWKVYVDNYLEGYHIPIVHPSLMRELDYNAYATITGRFHSLQHAPIRRSNLASGGPARRYTSADEQTRALYYWIFPNLMLNIYPDNFSVNLIIPVSHDRTLTIFEWYFLDPDSPEVKQKIERAIEFSDEIQQEDIRICEAVQRGLRSISYDRGRYSVSRENGVHHFHALLNEFLPAESEPR
jgi:choline monooxygenase